MQRSYLILAAIVVLSGCKKDAPADGSLNNGSKNIVGKWKLTDGYSSPGGGVGDVIPWIPITTDIYYLEFKSNGAFYNSADPYFVADHYTLTETTIKVNRGSKEMLLGYKIKPPYLEIYGPLKFDIFCFEFCGTRYISEK